MPLTRPTSATSPPGSSGGVLELSEPTPPSTGDYMIGGYHDFDGTDEYINFGSVAALELNVNGTWTVSAWVKRPGGTATMAAFGNAVEAAGVGGSTGWRISWTGALGIIFQDGAAYLNRYNVGQASNVWVHVMFVSNAGSLTIYKDGASVSILQTASGTVTSNNYTGSEVTFIGGQDDIGWMWDGEIAEVAVWSTDQSANVAAIYNSRARHNLMDLATPPDLFYAPLTSYGDDPGAGGSVAELVANNDGSGVNMETADAVGLDFDTSTSTLTKALDIATSIVTETTVDNVLSGATGGTGSSFP